jgi:hypothetical protein
MSATDAIKAFMERHNMPISRPKRKPKCKKEKRPTKYYVKNGDLGYDNKGKPIPYSKKEALKQINKANEK